MRIEDKLDLELSWEPSRISPIADYDIGALIKMLGNNYMAPHKSLKTVVYPTMNGQIREATVPLRTAFEAGDQVTVKSYMLNGMHLSTKSRIEIKMENSPHNYIRGISVEFAVTTHSSEQTKEETTNVLNTFNLLKDILLKCNKKKYR